MKQSDPYDWLKLIVISQVIYYILKFWKLFNFIIVFLALIFYFCTVI